MDFEISFNEALYYDHYLPEMTRVLEQIATGRKKAFYRSPEAIEAIRTLKKDGVTQAQGQSIYLQHIGDAVNKFILFDRANPFAYTLYDLDAGLIESLAHLNLENNRPYTFLTQLFDQTENEIFSIENSVSASVDMTSSANRRKLTAGLVAYKLEPKQDRSHLSSTVSLHQNDIIALTNLTVLVWNENRDHQDQWHQVNYDQKILWVSANSLEERTVPISSANAPSCVIPSVIFESPDDIKEALKHRFTLSFTVPHEIIDQLKTIKITSLQ